jgi:hypothetical protein
MRVAACYEGRKLENIVEEELLDLCTPRVARQRIESSRDGK